MEDSTFQAKADGATRRDLIAGVVGGVMLSSVPTESMAITPGSPWDELKQLMAIEAIKYRKARYAYCIDTKDWEGFGRNFTEDAVWDIRGARNPRNPATGEWTGIGDFSEEYLRSSIEGPIVGRSNIVKSASGNAGASVTAHKLFTPMIDILSDTQARAIWPFEDESYKEPSRPIRYANGVGYYHETYSKVGKDWLIKSTEVKRTFFVARKRIDAAS